ncbi:protein FAR1-RELATED SEQUENCE 5-like [Senna tora]|uniref:Protein FAR1-RELATED SEQUENCE 5-like n=1 Tax=Senna tora TaxID=362788 RepID=A0A834THZ5_9FABA|nr:protein FAR1-RELATED SEQUENCE 5-like [Senna tora]
MAGVTIRFNNICREANNIATKASVNQHVYNIAIDGLQKTLMNVELALKNMTFEDQFEAEKLEDTSQLLKLILDPPVKNHNGRPKKLKSFLDKKGKGKIKSTKRRSSKQ